MRYNGTLRYYVSPVTEVNEYGEPVYPEVEGESEETSAETPVSEWSDPVRCSILTIRNNNVVRTADGVERVSSFSVLLPDSSGYDYKERRKVLLERDGEDLGEFEVITSELVRSQGRIKIIV